MKQTNYEEMNYEEWRNFCKQPGAKGTMPHLALVYPCPKCGKHEGYNVTGDSYAYCNACGWGTTTEYAFTQDCLTSLDRDGKVVRTYPYMV